jgi:hypothetical protein
MTDTPNGSDRAAEALRAQIRLLRSRPAADARSRGHPADSAGGIDTGPASAYEAVTRQMVTDLAEDLREIKGRLNALFFALVGGILLDLLGQVLHL